MKTADIWQEVRSPEVRELYQTIESLAETVDFSSHIGNGRLVLRFRRSVTKPSMARRLSLKPRSQELLVQPCERFHHVGDA